VQQRKPAPVPTLADFDSFEFGRQTLYRGDCLEVMSCFRENTISGVVTDPPYALIEYHQREQRRLRTGNRGGVWRLPPSFDGYERRPLPRFTVLSSSDRLEVYDFFVEWGAELLRICRPGAHVFIASNTMMSPLVACAMEYAGFERRGEVARLVRTFRGGDRPKNAEDEYSNLSTTPRSCWEPWGIYRKPIECRTVAENLRVWKVGALKRFSKDQPFLDVIPSGLAPDEEREAAPHPSLKPQHFLRILVRSVLPLRGGIILDPFAGAASTLAACEYLKIRGVGIELDKQYYAMAAKALPLLSELKRPQLGRRQRFLPGL
jgi:DNA modification methylase